MNSPIFNPFSQIEIENDASRAAGGESTSASESTSNVNVNTVVGRCGRCAGAMVKVGLTTPPDTVYFCEQCRVTTPMTDEECAAADRQLHLGVRSGHQC